MFSHVILGANDLEASRNFMTRRWPLWGSVNRLRSEGAIFTVPTGVFGITNPINGEPATHGNGFTLGFAAESPEAVDALRPASKQVVQTARILPVFGKGRG